MNPPLITADRWQVSRVTWRRAQSSLDISHGSRTFAVRSPAFSTILLIIMCLCVCPEMRRRMTEARKAEARALPQWWARKLRACVREWVCVRSSGALAHSRVCQYIFTTRRASRNSYARSGDLQQFSIYSRNSRPPPPTTPPVII